MFRLLILPAIIGIITGFLWHEFLKNGYGKYGESDIVDKVQSVLIGICGFLVSGAFINV